MRHDVEHVTVYRDIAERQVEPLPPLYRVDSFTRGLFQYTAMHFDVMIDDIFWDIRR